MIKKLIIFTAGFMTGWYVAINTDQVLIEQRKRAFRDAASAKP